ncbi:tetratricopeptide repeat-containing sensor histidine kinase [Flavobacterium taihuense]|uniref:histidine kinase n=1 Tax=Flavobacterium taihuense TaxID=2857508 RepID=A0ABS6XTG2_9FLAO|nr:tetratricopeptide repeat-containing sensor histidine kinase [Flavobacterium taihuense]MBW4359957.1 tetratricopeptide repeat-containing sensor histidine kinase [Flavobacterium taihuense]
MIQKITLLIFFVLILSFTPISAQNAAYKTIDSLKLELRNSKNDSDKALLLTKLSSYSEYIGPDEAINYAKKGLYYAQKTKNEKLIGDAYGNLGTAYEIKSDYAHALKNLYKALTIFENLNDKTKLISIFNNLGLIYIDLKNYPEGLIFYNKALRLSYQSKKERNVSLLLNNIGDVYLQKKEYKNALNYFYKALIINKKLEDIEGIGLNLSNIGICNINLKNYEKGIEMLNKSIATYDDVSSLFNTYNIYDLGRAHYLMSQDDKYKNDKNTHIEKSIRLLENALQNFKKYNSLKDIQETYFYLSKVNKVKGNFAVALDCFEKYSEIKDSIFSKESKKKLANVKFQREIDLRDKQIEIQTLRINSETRKVYLLITISISVAALLGLFLFLYVSKRKNNQLLKEKNILISNINAQKDKFYSIIAHDLRGPFNGFLGLTELMAEDIDLMSKDEIKFAAINMKSSAQNLFNLLENLLEWSRMEQNLIPFDPQEYPLKQFVLDSIITLNNNADKKGINISTNIPNSIEIFADKNMLQAIIRNVVLNAIKFTQKNGAVTIQGKQEGKNTIITVSDNGIGMSPKTIQNLFNLDGQNNRIGTDDEPSTGLGLILCREFIDKHKGKIWVESEEGKGTTFYISFPNRDSNLI